MELKDIFPQSVTVVLNDGNSYEISLPRCKELVAIEERFDTSFIEAFAGGIDWSKAGNVAFVAHLLMRRKHPELSLDAVLDLVDYDNIATVFNAIKKALDRSRPTSEMTEVASKNSDGQDTIE